MEVLFFLIVLFFLSILDIIFTHARLDIHIKRNPDDKNWPDLENNRFARWTFKKFGLCTTSFILQVLHSFILLGVFFGIVHILNWDLEFFLYTIFGGLVFVNMSHYESYRRLKNEQYPFNKQTDKKRE